MAITLQTNLLLQKDSPRETILQNTLLISVPLLPPPFLVRLPTRAVVGLAPLLVRSALVVSLVVSLLPSLLLLDLLAQLDHFEGIVENHLPLLLLFQLEESRIISRFRSTAHNTTFNNTNGSSNRTTSESSTVCLGGDASGIVLLACISSSRRSSLSSFITTSEKISKPLAN